MGGSVEPSRDQLDEILFFARATLVGRDPQAISRVGALKHELGEGRPGFESPSLHHAEEPDALFRWLERAVFSGQLVLEKVPEIRVRTVPRIEAPVQPGMGPSDDQQERFIGVQIFDQENKPVVNSRVRIELPDGDVKESRTNRAGEVMVKGFVQGGQAKITLLDFPEPGPAEAIPVVETTDYAVNVVDQAGTGIAGVPLWFKEGGKRSLKLTDSSGLATYTPTGEGEVKVSFQSAPALAKVMQTAWAAAAGAPRADWLQPSEDTLVVELHGGEVVQRGAPAITDINDLEKSELPPATRFDGQALTLGQPLTLSVQPRVGMLRLMGMSFDSNKSFLLPSVTTLSRIKEMYEAHPDCHLVIAGHADTEEDPAQADALSLARAQMVLAFLQDDIAVWLQQYGTSVPEGQRWGASEDRLMLKGIVARKQGLESLEVTDYQAWHNALPPEQQAWNWQLLEPDGELAELTRAQLIGDYMNLDQATLPTNIYPVVHGCGSAFPAPPPDPGSAAERFSDQRHRRVEFLFFDSLTGVQPEPEGDVSNAGSQDYPEWLLRAEIENLETGDLIRQVRFVEMQDTLFRTKSALVLPEGEDPTSDSEEHRSLTSVGLIATILRYNEEHEGKKLFIAGHTDTAGSEGFNQPLSEDRAQAVLALLTGDRETFASTCLGRHDEIDITQIFDWTSLAFGFTCKPTRLDAAPNDTRYVQFRQSYNAWVDGWDPAVETDPRSPNGHISIQGRNNKDIFEAFFDLYEYNLRQELGENAAGVAELRGRLVWVDDSRKSLGFGEHHPIDNLGRDNYRSQANRRVEVLMFDEGEEPDLAAAEASPETAELYGEGEYQWEHLEPMVSATASVSFRYGFPVGGDHSWSENAVFTIVSEDGSHRQDFAMTEGELVGDYRVFSFAAVRPSVRYLGYVTDASVRYDLFGPVALSRVQDPQDPTNCLPFPNDTEPPASDPGPEPAPAPEPVSPLALLAEYERNNEPPDPEMVAQAAGPFDGSVV